MEDLSQNALGPGYPDNSNYIDNFSRVGID